MKIFKNIFFGGFLLGFIGLIFWEVLGSFGLIGGLILFLTVGIFYWFMWEFCKWSSGL